MNSLFFLFISFFLASQILFQKGYKKLIWFLVGVLFLPLTVVVIAAPYTIFPRFLIIVFCIVFFIQNNKIKLKLKKFPFFNSLVIILIGFFAIGFFDDRIDIVSKIMRPAYYFIENFAIFFLAYFYVKSLEDVKRIYNFILVCFVFFTVYGIINHLTGFNSYSNFIAETFKSTDFGNRYAIMGDSRSRIASFAWHPIYYGFVLSCGILILVFVLAEKRMQIYKKFIYSIIFCLLSVNLFWTNSRTPLLALIIGLSVFYLFAITLGNKVKIALISIIAILTLVSISPNSFKLIDESINTFTSSGSKLEGSSVEMREVQMGASIVIFTKSPYFGNGFNYINENLGFSANDDDRSSDSDFAGFESYIYKLLIEQGLIGIFINLYFFIKLFVFLFKNRKNVDLLGQRIIYLSISLTVSFLLFIIGTGDMGSFMIYMLLLGINLKAILLSFKNKNIPRNIFNANRPNLKMVSYEQ